MIHFRSFYDVNLPDGPDNQPGPPATQEEAVNEFVDHAGLDDPEREWILSDYDTWHHNPHYSGPKGRHPEADDYDDEVFGPFQPAPINDEIPF